jgi:hypothetical protein
MARIRIREEKTKAVFAHKFRETTFDEIELGHYTHIVSLTISAKTIPGWPGYRLLAGAMLFREATPVALIEMRSVGDGIFIAPISIPELSLWINHYGAKYVTKHPIALLFPHQSPHG